MLYHAAALSRQVTGRRLSVLDRLAAGEKLIVITTVDALLQPNLPLEVFSSSIMEIAEGRNTPGRPDNKGHSTGLRKNRSH